MQLPLCAYHSADHTCNKMNRKIDTVSVCHINHGLWTMNEIGTLLEDLSMTVNGCEAL